METAASHLAIGGRRHQGRRGRIFSAFLLGYALCQIPAGMLADRWGARRGRCFVVVHDPALPPGSGRGADLPRVGAGSSLLDPNAAPGACQRRRSGFDRSRVAACAASCLSLHAALGMAHGHGGFLADGAGQRHGRGYHEHGQRRRGLHLACSDAVAGGTCRMGESAPRCRSSLCCCSRDVAGNLAG